jgi:hypothetical protein
MTTKKNEDSNQEGMIERLCSFFVMLRNQASCGLKHLSSLIILKAFGSATPSFDKLRMTSQN